MSPPDFPEYGVAGEWYHRRFEFFAGQVGEPTWAVHLGHRTRTRTGAAYVGLALMAGPGG